MRKLTFSLLVFALWLPTVRAELTPEVLRRAKARVESLLGNRRGASPAPVNPANPFVLPQSAPVTSEGPAPVTTSEIPLTKTGTLARLAASLNVSGYVQIQGVPHLIINKLAYRENDLIPVKDAAGSVSFLRIKNITESDFILELDEIELQLKHTVK